MASFWEDHYRKHSLEAKKRGPTGEVMFETGDELIDKWEREVQAGLVPDLFEGLPSRYRERARELDSKKQKIQQRAQTEQVDLDGFSDDYSR